MVHSLTDLTSEEGMRKVRAAFLRRKGVTDDIIKMTGAMREVEKIG